MTLLPTEPNTVSVRPVMTPHFTLPASISLSSRSIDRACTDGARSKPSPLDKRAARALSRNTIKSLNAPKGGRRRKSITRMFRILPQAIVLDHVGKPQSEAKTFVETTGPSFYVKDISQPSSPEY